MRAKFFETKFLLKTIKNWEHKTLSLYSAKAIPLPPASSCCPLVSSGCTTFQKDLLLKEGDLLKTEKNVLSLYSQNHSLKICGLDFPWMLKRYKTVIKPYEPPKLKYMSGFHLQIQRRYVYYCSWHMTLPEETKKTSIFSLILFFPFKQFSPLFIGSKTLE